MKKLFCGIISIFVALSAAVPAGAAAVTDFEDVPAGAWFYDAVDHAAKNGLFQGTSAATFGPDVTMSRGMFITVLGRMANVPDTYGRTKTTPFTDVTQADYWFPCVAWAKDNGIAVYSGDKIYPDEAVPREEMAYMVYRYAIQYGYAGTYSPERYDTFTDTAGVSAYAVSALQWAAAHGVINGSGGKIDPRGDATRAQVAQIFFNFSKLAAEWGVPREPDVPFTDTPDWENYNPAYDIPTGHSATDADGGYYDYDLANAVMEEVNALRAEYGLDALLYNPKIQEWAGIRAREQTVLFSHTRPDGSDCLTVGQGLCFENLLKADDYTATWKSDIQGYANECAVAWLNSENHRRSMLSSSANLGAVSCYVVGDNVYMAQLFSKRTLYFMDYLI